MKALMWNILLSVFAYMALSVGTLLMISMVIDYASFRTDIHFLQYKQSYLPDFTWRIAFYGHVFSSVVSLAAGLTQFSSYLRTKYIKLHRIIGKLYVFNVLIINFPAAMILAINANGLLPSKMAFTILDLLWFYFTAKAWTTIRKGEVEKHRAYMIRSFALTFSAITLRTWKIILSSSFSIDPLSLYMIEAWMGFVPNLLFAEWWIYRDRKIAARIPERQKK